MTARSRLWRPLLSLAAGLALAFAFPNYNLPLLGWVSVAGLIIACVGASLGEAALCGFLYGAAFYTFSIPWIYRVMHLYGPMPAWQAAAILALLVTQQSVLYIFFALPLAWMARRGTNLALLAVPFLWVAVELLRSRLGDLSFPWNLLGYIVVRNLAVSQLASLAGVYGLSFLVAAYNALLASFVLWFLSTRSQRTERPRHPQPSLIPTTFAGYTIALVTLMAFGGRFVPQPQPTAMAHLVQTDLPTANEIPANWNEIHAADMAQLDRISIAAGEEHAPGEATQAANAPSLIVWPEVPAPFSLQQQDFAQRAARIARDSGSDFLLGVVDWKPLAPGRAGTPSATLEAPYNSAALLDPEGREEFLYDKMHLVPFSEYVPGRSWLWFAKDLTALAGDFHHGTRYSVGKLPGGRFSVFICYEAVFPNEIRRFVQNGAALLINISNDGWLGRSSGPVQSLMMARMRAIENRRWLLRDTNNGFTAAIDPYGRIVASLAPDIRGELDAPYAFRDDLTFYTRAGDWLPWLCVAVSVLLLVAEMRTRAKPASAPPASRPSNKAGASRKRAVAKAV